MQANFTSRKINAVELFHVAQQEHILHPESLALKLKHRANPLDVGGLAYSKRKKVKGFFGLIKPPSFLAVEGF